MLPERVLNKLRCRHRGNGSYKLPPTEPFVVLDPEVFEKKRREIQAQGRAPPPPLSPSVLPELNFDGTAPDSPRYSSQRTQFTQNSSRTIPLFKVYRTHDTNHNEDISISRSTLNTQTSDYIRDDVAIYAKSSIPITHADKISDTEGPASRTTTAFSSDLPRNNDFIAQEYTIIDSASQTVSSPLRTEGNTLITYQHSEISKIGKNDSVEDVSENSIASFSVTTNENERHTQRSPKRKRAEDEAIQSPDDVPENMETQYHIQKHKRSSSSSSNIDTISTLQESLPYRPARQEKVDEVFYSKQQTQEIQDIAKEAQNSRPLLSPQNNHVLSAENGNRLISDISPLKDFEKDEPCAVSEDIIESTQSEVPSHILQEGNESESSTEQQTKYTEDKPADSVLSRRISQLDLSVVHETHEESEETYRNRAMSLSGSPEQRCLIRDIQNVDSDAQLPATAGNEDTVDMEDIVGDTQKANGQTTTLAEEQEHPKEPVAEQSAHILKDQHTDYDSNVHDMSNRARSQLQYDVDDDYYFGGIESPIQSLSQYDQAGPDMEGRNLWMISEKERHIEDMRIMSRDDSAIYAGPLDVRIPPASDERLRIMEEFMEDDDLPMEVNPSELQRIIKRVEAQLDADSRVAKRRKQADTELSSVIDPINKTIMEFRDEQRDTLTKRLVVEFGKNTANMFEELKELYHEHMQLEWKLKRVKNIQAKERKRLLEVRKRKDQIKRELRDVQKSTSMSQGNRKEWMDLQNLFSKLKAARSKS
ncbi:hypothetical protein EC973_008024 [Apophysomyces ossiformis]|uniref:Uncharacterized protein n=1 Tax=Apophysomyces ossiformis TaxID=679940 RepID=A0A8H7BTC7_9FUNG|nr:hypothetical protein EC973_008024 [Apophysomyces ossiformis]